MQYRPGTISELQFVWLGVCNPWQITQPLVVGFPQQENTAFASPTRCISPPLVRNSFSASCSCMVWRCALSCTVAVVCGQQTLAIHSQPAVALAHALWDTGSPRVGHRVVFLLMRVLVCEFVFLRPAARGLASASSTAVAVDRLGRIPTHSDAAALRAHWVTSYIVFPRRRSPCSFIAPSCSPSRAAIAHKLFLTRFTTDPCSPPPRLHVPHRSQDV